MRCLYFVYFYIIYCFVVLLFGSNEPFIRFEPSELQRRRRGFASIGDSCATVAAALPVRGVDQLSLIRSSIEFCAGASTDQRTQNIQNIQNIKIPKLQNVQTTIKNIKYELWNLYIIQHKNVGV